MTDGGDEIMSSDEETGSGGNDEEAELERA